METGKFLKGRHALVASALLGVYMVQPMRPMVFVGDSMAPTYHSWEMVWMTKAPRPLKRGDVVVVQCDMGRIVKRVAYLPGDELSQTQINGEWINVDGDLVIPDAILATHPFRVYTVPSDSVYLLGDNRVTSVDSRQHGPFKLRQIEGVVVNLRPKQTTYPAPLVRRRNGSMLASVAQ